MYKYSKRAEEKFFSDPNFSFLFSAYAMSHMGLSYTKIKLESSKKKELSKGESRCKGEGRKEGEDEFGSERHNMGGIEENKKAGMSGRIISEIFQMHNTYS
jgi:hypothetical protein